MESEGLEPSATLYEQSTLCQNPGLITINHSIAVSCNTFANGTLIDRCYKHFDIIRKYFDAQDFCKEFGGHLMEINSAAEDRIITELIGG